MSNDPNKRPVRVTYAKSDKVRTVHVPRQSADASAPIQPPRTESSPDATAASLSPLERDTPVLSPVPETPFDAAATSGQDSESVGSVRDPSEPDSGTAGQKNAGAGKPKPDIETLEQFIEYAYGRKGQRVSLKTKVEKAIAQNPRLDDGALSRLLALSEGDALLTVPRQLLLVSRDIDGYPALRASLGSFVSTVMQRHPAFADPGVQSALRNLPEALPAGEALAKVAAYSPADEDGAEPLKGAELQALRRNAAHLFATWLAINRGMNSEELAALLFPVLWLPAARDLADDSARLRALTEIEQPAGVGLACQRFRQQAIEARSSQEQALREANELRMRLAEADAQKLSTEEQRDALEAELQALRASTAAEAAELRRQHEVERTHLRHDQEQLRGRLQRRLDEGVEMLEVGLTALRNKTPRVEVMMERAEHVVDALRAEMNSLREE
jgi:hypothetical protein